MVDTIKKSTAKDFYVGKLPKALVTEADAAAGQRSDIKKRGGKTDDAGYMNIIDPVRNKALRDSASADAVKADNERLNQQEKAREEAQAHTKMLREHGVRTK